MRDELVERAAAGESRSANDQADADPAIEQARLRRREGETVVGREDHQRALVEPGLLERVEDAADAVVERARARLVGGDVLADLGRIGEERRRQRVDAIADRARREEASVRLEEADRHEERLADAAAQRLDRRRADRVHASVGDLVHDVVAEHVRIGGDVLLADQLGVVAVAPSALGRADGRSRSARSRGAPVPSSRSCGSTRRSAAPRGCPSTTVRHRRRCGT